MNRVVCDTNVLASGMASRSSTPGHVLDAWRSQRFILLVSAAILTELSRTLANPYFQDRMRPDEVRESFEAILNRAEHVILPTAVGRVATHPEDDLILATAVQGRAHYLVTGDRQLQLLDAHAGVAIVSPRAFLDLLERD